ncbi:MAG: hypothetical protein DHS20C16_00650 [Phycisphaerae bacterium]|nr:MAG: hypothetical protein DHS20C16_00650 [Phycisphaerae bacterium]
MVAPTSPQPDPDPLQQANPQSPSGMGAHGWSRMIVGIIFLAALLTVVIRGIYVVANLEESPPPTAPTTQQ